MSDEETLKQIREQFRVTDDARPVGVVAELGLDPDRWLSVAEAIADGEEPDVPPATTDDEELNQQTDPDDGDVLVNDGSEEPPERETPDGVVDSWRDADFIAPESGVWPTELLEREQWMGHSDKKPFAPWSDKNPDTACNSSDCPADRADDPDCDCDGRFKWSHEGHYVDGETVDMAEDDPRLDGRVFLQTDRDPYAFVDGDDVRDPDTGEIHPDFLAVIEQLGISYADISTSGAGVHINYRGELPNGIPEASWTFDDEPWRDAHDDPPAIEFYSNKHVCVATGEHVRGSGTEIADWDAEALETILDDHGQLRQTTTERSSIDLDGYEPDKTEASETTTDIRDQFAALNRLDARKVAEETIVQRWNDDVSTSAGKRAFYPTWGNSNCDGRANIVDKDIWNDTGTKGGYGGPLVMALIDAGEISEKGAVPADTRGSNYFTAVEHLRDLGFDIPELEDDADAPILRKPAASSTDDATAEDDEDDDQGRELGSPPGLVRRSDGYYKQFTDNETGEVTHEKLVANCHLRTTSRLTHQNGDREFRIEVQPAQGDPYEVDVEPTVLNDKRKFRENVLVGWSTTFDGSQEDLNAVKQFVAAQEAPSRRGTRHIGIHGDEFVGPTGSLRVDGWADDPQTVYTDDSSQLNPLWQLDPEMGDSYDEEDVAEMLRLIPQTRRGERFLPVLGWFYASVMRPHIMDWEGEFNILNVLGDTGSGKTTTLETLWRMFGMDGELLAADSTAFTQLTAISSTNALPVIFDEYKPADMRDYVVEKLKSYIRLSTRGGIESKGNADRSTDNYHLRAPVCVSGEQPIQGPAEERRTILTTFTRDVISGETDETRSFTELVGGEFADERFDGYELERHAMAYYQWVLDQDTDELHGLWHEARDRAASILNDAGVTVADLDDMVMQGFQTVWFGCEIYRRFAESVGIDREECPVSDRDIERALLYIADEGTGFEHISHLDRLLALMSRAADADYLQEEVHYTLVSPRGSGPDTELCIRLEASFDKVRQYCRDHDVRESDILNSADDYRPRLRDNKEQGIYVSSTSKPTKFEELGQRRSIGFDIDALDQHVDDFAGGAFYGDDAPDSDEGKPVLASMDLGHMQSFTAEVAAIGEGEYSREAQGKLKGPHGTYIGFVVPGGNTNQLAGGKGKTYQFDAITVRTDDDGLREAVVDDAADVTKSPANAGGSADASVRSDGGEGDADDSEDEDLDGAIPAVQTAVVAIEGREPATREEIIEELADDYDADVVEDAIDASKRKGNIREDGEDEFRCLS